MKTYLFVIATMALTACVSEPDNSSNESQQPGDLIFGQQDGELLEREPDLCHAADYQQFLGQPGNIVPTLGITRTYRIISHGQIFSQEYNAGRLNFRLAPSGTITKIDCG